MEYNTGEGSHLLLEKACIEKAKFGPPCNAVNRVEKSGGGEEHHVDCEVGVDVF